MSYGEGVAFWALGEMVKAQAGILESDSAQVAEEKKPDAVRVKIVEGRIRKFYEERVLLEQKFVKDDKRTVGELVKELSAKTGEKVEVRRFVRFELGGN